MAAIMPETDLRSRAETLIAPTIRAALAGFHRQNVSYCYWKSSRRIAAALSSDTDLDLLIAIEDQHRAVAILLGNGFKLVPSAASHGDPTVLTFLGHDEETGRLVHVDLHSRLMTGASLLKNYRLRWERIVLARAVLHPTLPIKMLDPVSEALLLVVRACFELRRSDAVALRHWKTVRRKFALDRAELAAKITREQLRSLAVELISEDVADALADALWSIRPLERQGRLRRRLRKRLAADRTYNAVEARVRSWRRATLWAFGGLNTKFLHAPRSSGCRAHGGGRVIAVLGVDGSGKSTAVATMRAWLGSEIDVMPIYFGTGAGRPALWLIPLKLMAPLVTRFLKTKPNGASHGKVTNRPPGPLYSALMMVWATAVAVEKQAKLLAAHRGAGRGLVVLADRYPQDEIPDFNDGPLLPRLSRAPRWLRRFEAGAYALSRRLPPDLVIKLEVAPETAARREQDMDPAVIQRRIAAVGRLTFRSARVVSIRADRPLAEVTRAIKSEIWRLL